MSKEAQTRRAKDRPSRASRAQRLREPSGAAAEPSASGQLLEAEISPVWEVLPQFGAVSDNPGVRMMRRRDALLRRLLGASDMVAGGVALGCAVGFVPGEAVQIRPAAVLLAPFLILVSKALGLYDRDQHRLRKVTLDELPSLLNLAVFYALTVWLVQGLVLVGNLARLQVFALTVATFALTGVCRSASRAFARKLTPPERCLVVASAVDADRIATKFTESPGVKAVIVGRVCLTDEERQAEPSLGDARSLPARIKEHAVERVIIAPDGHEQEAILHCIRLVKALGVKVSVLPRLLEVVGSASVFDEIDGTTLLGVPQYGLSRSSEILKRATDIVGASVALAVLAPLLALLALAIRLDSQGPAFFRQPRIGRRGERFWMIKFRSMVQGADGMKDGLRDLNEAQGGLFKLGNDPRITRVGHFLRRTSLDELPQLLNVLKGEMSLVGPRPLVQAEDALIEGWQRRRLAVKPGMTGLWQIYGSSRIPMDEMVKIDYLYGANWSIWLDLKIMIRTVPYMFGRRGL